jgi:hypothetical protein
MTTYYKIILSTLFSTSLYAMDAQQPPLLQQPVLLRVAIPTSTLSVLVPQPDAPSSQENTSHQTSAGPGTYQAQVAFWNLFMQAIAALESNHSSVV